MTITNGKRRFVRPAVDLVLLMVAGLSTPATGAGQAGGDTDAVEPPVAYRPAEFRGAIGWGLKIRMRATPTELQAEEPLLLTVTITGNGNLQTVQRPDLGQLPRFAQHFHIENLGDRVSAAEKTREFDYRLRPRTAAVKEIPPLRFVYFNPKMFPSEKGYQTALAPAITLTVRPRAQVRTAQVQGPPLHVEPPASVYQLATGAVVLRSDSPFALPGPGALAVLFLGPPVLGGLWYLSWRRRHPQDAHQAHKRRSRASQNALRAIRRLGTGATPAEAQQAETILAEYLRQRLDLRTAEPTPAEVADHLEQAGASATLANEVADFFGHCDAARFAPGLAEKADDWPARANRLVLALEDASWPS